MNNNFFENLNDQQREAVTTTEGPVVVVAGAGSGKTRVITYRLAYLVGEKGVFPRNILAVTFTNKAAEEMRNRVHRLLGTVHLESWIGTFHATCLAFLRRDAHLLGYKRNFTIYDESEQLHVIKHVMKRLSLSEKDYNPHAILNHISLAKNKMLEPDEYESRAVSLFEEKVVRVFRRYTEALREQNAMDFDDLLNNALALLRRFPEAAEKYRHFFRYIMVDEFQDTNHVQYELVRGLASEHRNLCIVGDDDQSIYSWRGADVENLLSFQKDFPDAKSIFLEENYRSTQSILAAANAVISNNERKQPKHLWTQKTGGENILWFHAPDEYGEARFIVNQILNLKFQRPELKNQDFAVFYRTNAQSRVIEDILREAGLPYVVIGNVRFYDRREIKDILAYLKILVNPADAVALRRIINVPARGIGKVTLEKAEAFAKERNIPLLEAIGRSSEISGLRADARVNLDSFARYLADLREKMERLNTAEMITEIVQTSGYLKMLKQEPQFEAQARMENLDELVSASAEAGKDKIEDFIETVSLRSDIDDWDDTKDYVALMTLHSAKGLEFPVVFMAGMEEELLPHINSMLSEKALEEERRLCYVGITRAKERLFLVSAYLRHSRGMTLVHQPSRFINEIPEDILSTPPKEAQSHYDREYGQVEEELDYHQLRAGDLIEHATFGAGRIDSVSGSGEKMKVAVRFFRDNKQRDLMVKYANLRKK